MKTLTVQKNQVFRVTYTVEKHSPDGQFLGSMAGIGRNRGTWASECLSRRTAQRWAAECRKDDPNNRYSVSER